MPAKVPAYRMVLPRLRADKVGIVPTELINPNAATVQGTYRLPEVVAKKVGQLLECGFEFSPKFLELLRDSEEHRKSFMQTDFAQFVGQAKDLEAIREMVTACDLSVEVDSWPLLHTFKAAESAAQQAHLLRHLLVTSEDLTSVADMTARLERGERPDLA
ncbi:hypothetical protein ACFL5U_04170 [Candidatus Margulisiibacteriota bacterium]